MDQEQIQKEIDLTDQRIAEIYDKLRALNLSFRIVVGLALAFFWIVCDWAFYLGEKSPLNILGWCGEQVAFGIAWWWLWQISDGSDIPRKES